MPAQFDIRAAEPAAVERISQSLMLPRFIAATLVSRGFDTPEAARAFLSSSLERDWLNPYDLPGLPAVADALEPAMRDHRHIVVFGDFDLDGLSATTVLTRGLRELGAHATPFIPRRFEEGYALTEASMERLCAMEPAPDFVVTVDCGIACKDQVAQLRARGIDVAITDHHEPLDLVPEDVPVADPKLDPDCPSIVLAGVGVALKLVQLLGGRMGKPHLWREYTDFAALGTVADLMPMLAENRALVEDGIRHMNENPRPCIRALLAEAGAADKPVSSTSLSFSIIPRLNAAGRMGNAELALEALMSDTAEEARDYARQLEEMNDRRRSIEAELSETAQAQAIELYRGQRALVVAGEGWHEGVKGIVASRLVGIYGVPTILFAIEGDEARGSGRSVGQVNLLKAVESASDLLTRFGGHGAAVGVTLPTRNLAAFNKRLCDYMDTLDEDEFHPLFRIDAEVSLDELTIRNVELLEKLAPFGQENPTPMFLARDVALSNRKAVGQGKNHFSCSISDGRGSVQGIMFHCRDIDELMATEGLVHAAFNVQIDEWRGRRNVKAMVKSLTPAYSCKALEDSIEPGTKSFLSDLYAKLPHDETARPGKAAADEMNRAGKEDSRYKDDAQYEQRRAWEQLARRNPAALGEAVIWTLIGNRPLHSAQHAVLSCLEHGESVLAVMATGRGKSLIFHVHATMLALRFGKVSIFVYPLRALIADQAYHLENSLGRFGIRSVVLNGETQPAARAEIYAQVRSGDIDIILTTPEFLQFHSDTFASFGNIGFVVVDEAHHIGAAHAGHRETYAQIGEAIRKLGAPRPTVLALTATATTAAAHEITAALPIDRLIVDESSRGNLLLDDRRNSRNRDDYLANLIARGEKTIVYVNSRESSVDLARILRRRVPQIATMIGFYNAGLTRTERKRVEDLFRSGRLTVLVATSAFGEGIDIPNVRHVVLYHLPFNETEFNQMSGRAGRDGQEAVVHLLYDRADAAMNEAILRDSTPDRDAMAVMYRWLRSVQRAHGAAPFTIGAADFEQLAHRREDPVSPGAAACGIKVFRELGLIEASTRYAQGEISCSVRVIEGAAKVELSNSVRYREGLGEQEIFRAFREWALGSPDAILRRRVCHPIVPESHDLMRGEDVHRDESAGDDGEER